MHCPALIDWSAYFHSQPNITNACPALIGWSAYFHSQPNITNACPALIGWSACWHSQPVAIKCFPAVLFTVFYSSHRAICRPSDRTLRRFRDEIRTRDGGPQVPGRFEPKAGGGLEPVMKIMYYFYFICYFQP